MGTRAIAVVGSLLLLLAACGSDGDDSSSDTDEATTTEAAAPEETDDETAEEPVAEDEPAAEPTDGAAEAPPEDSGGGGTGGSMTLTVGEESWSFEDVFCAFSPEEAGNESVSFFVTTIANGLQPDASIIDNTGEGRYEGDGVIQSISIHDIEDFENPTVAYSAENFITGEPLIFIDGKSITGGGNFDDERTDEIEEIPGTLEASCP